ncbi:SRPBCC domain-containing protein [Chitinophaga flava]|uniref:Polyketide cyclase n=1 Tax=Chitinophaga flava TaxID=2259036 RepID=A0A365XSH6_9BACT|nr:SRPBCC domain-containing protein [Chitinophaga flava]RBL89317.1 polyketide cyclase [Chitinophaga flava]
MNTHLISATTLVQAPIETVWACWTDPGHIRNWNTPSNDWHTPHAENDVRPGGRFLFVMKAKDDSDGFNFEGAYDEVVLYKKLSYTTTDGRKTTDLFEVAENGVKITELFEPDANMPAEAQQEFCAGVLNTFKGYVEQL